MFPSPEPKMNIKSKKMKSTVFYSYFYFWSVVCINAYNIVCDNQPPAMCDVLFSPVVGMLRFFLCSTLLLTCG